MVLGSRKAESATRRAVLEEYCVSADNMDCFFQLLGGQLLQCVPNELNDGGGVLAAAIAADPRQHILKVI